MDGVAWIAAVEAAATCFAGVAGAEVLLGACAPCSLARRAARRAAASTNRMSPDAALVGVQAPSCLTLLVLARSRARFLAFGGVA